ncbi:MAG: hypothetical protein KGS61_16900 [Verrucomicrobia bacterium]|nr:hypothetical protein [Verrucomicrobiota bacterium]
MATQDGRGTNELTGGLRRAWRLRWFSTALLLGFHGLTAQAVLFYSSGDPSHNTTPPTGALTDSGWQLEGQWGSFLGTPIAPNYFITARHVGGNIGEPFVYAGATYPTAAVFDDPDSDLRIWRVCGTFPTYAMLYANTNEVGMGLVVFGRGTQRGDPVSVAAGVTNGWFWGPPDGVQRWGTNVVADAVDGDQLFPVPGSRLGSLLEASFSAGGADQATLSTGDSAGGVFIRDAGVWKLAGINYGVDGLFNTTTNGAGFDAAIFDERGLYLGMAGDWTLVPASGPDAVPSAFYATRISSNLSWILSVISTTVPADAPALQSASTFAGPYADDLTGTLDAQARTITVPLAGQTRFYRLRACVPLAVTGVQIVSGEMVLNY